MTASHARFAADSVAGVAARFRERFGRSPEGVWQAPGRVNLIGEHTDYNSGLALPFAIDRKVVVAAARRGDHTVRAWSAQRPEGKPVRGEIGHLFPQSSNGWGAYALGVLWAFGQAGADLCGLDLAVDSTVPLGGGLSSSAALLAAVARAVDELNQFGAGRRTLVEICHRAEAGFVGAPVGRLDQVAVLCGRRGHGLLIDFADLRIEEVPLAVGPLAVVDTGVRHGTAAAPTPPGTGSAKRRPTASG